MAAALKLYRTLLRFHHHLTGNNIYSFDPNPVVNLCLAVVIMPWTHYDPSPCDGFLPELLQLTRGVHTGSAAAGPTCLHWIYLFESLLLWFLSSLWRAWAWLVLCSNGLKSRIYLANFSWKRGCKCGFTVPNRKEMTEFTWNMLLSVTGVWLLLTKLPRVLSNKSPPLSYMSSLWLTINSN